MKGSSMTRELLTTEELAARIKYDPRTIRECIDLVVSAQVMPLMQMPQREFSCSALDVGADGCKSQSSPR